LPGGSPAELPADITVPYDVVCCPVVRDGDVGGQLGAAAHGGGVAAALGQDRHLAPALAQPLLHLRRVLQTVRGTVEIVEPHAARDGVGQRRVERQVLLAADDADGLEPVPAAGGGHRPDVVGVGAAEGQHTRMAQVVAELARLVVVAHQEHPHRAERGMTQLLHDPPDVRWR
jgi:hypothetical protein